MAAGGGAVMGEVRPRRGHTERPFGGAHGRIGAADGVLCLALQRRVPAFCEVARAACDTTAAGSLPHGLWGAREGPGLAIWTGVLVATGAAVADESLGLLGCGRAGHSSIFFFGDCRAPEGRRSRGFLRWFRRQGCLGCLSGA